MEPALGSLRQVPVRCSGNGHQPSRETIMRGGGMVWSPSVLATAVPNDRNSMVWSPHMWVFSSSPDPDDPGGLQGVGLVLHPGHGQLPRLVEGLGEVGELHVLSGAPQRLAQSPMGDVVNAGPHDQTRGTWPVCMRVQKS